MRSYRTPQQPIHDHFRRAGDLVALEAYAIDGLQRVRLGGEPREPRGKDDQVRRADLGHVPNHAGLTLASIRDDLGRYEAHQVDDLASREVGDCADVVDGDPRRLRQVRVDPLTQVNLHRVDVLDGPSVSR